MAKGVKYSFYRPHDPVRHDGGLVNPVTGEVTYPPSKTKQSMLAECDVNRIIKQFSTTGQINHISAKAAMGAYMDLPGELDFQFALNTVIEGERAFATLPAKVRDRFANSPAAFLEFLGDPKNKDEAIALGLIKRPPPKQETPPVSTPPGSDDKKKPVDN